MPLIPSRDVALSEAGHGATRPRRGGVRRDRLRFGAAAAVAAVSVTIFWWQIVPARLDAGMAIAELTVAWDLRTYFVPKFVFGTTEILHGQLPVWNQYEYAGMPFLATAQPAALYPPKILAFALLSPPTALTALLAAHHLILALSMLLFLRSQGISAVGTLAGSLYVSFTIPFLFSIYHPNRIASVAWLPLLFLLANRAATSQHGAPLIALALVWAAQLLAGYPEFSVDSALLLGVHAMTMLALGAWPPPWWRRLARVGAGFSLGCAAAAIQLLPLADLLAGVNRAEVVKASAYLSSGPVVSAFAVGALWGFPSLLGLAFAGLGRRGMIPPAAGLALCLLFIPLGVPLLRWLSGHEVTRHSLTWVLLAQFFLGWMVAVGVDGLGRTASATGRALGPRLTALAALAGAALCVWRMFATGRWWIGPNVLWAFGAPMILATSGRAGTAGITVANAAGLAGGLLLALVALMPARMRPRSLWLAGALALLASSHVATFPFGALLPPLTKPASVASSMAHTWQGDGTEAVRVLSLHDVTRGTPLLDRVENVFGMEESMPPSRLRRVAERLRVDLWLRRMDWAALAESEGFLDALDVRFVVAPTSMAPVFAAHGLDLVETYDAKTAIYRNRDPGARAWVVYGAVTVGSQEAALARVLSLDFDPRRQVVLEQAPAGTYPAQAPRVPSTASLRRISPTQLIIDAQVEAPGVLVLAESCFPGWTASVDDRPVDILCANFATRAVELPPGRHRVRFEYRPSSLVVGAAVSLVALFVLPLLVVCSHRKRA